MSEAGTTAGMAAGTKTLVLPPADTKRWVPRRKAEVIHAIRDGVIGRREACDIYGLSLEELHLWERAIDLAGTPGLRVTRVQLYRDVFERRA